MAKVKAETGLAITNEATVTQGIEFIRTQLAGLKTIEATKWKTDGKITMGNGSQKDLKEETNQTELVKAFSTIMLRCKALDDAYDALGINPAPVAKIDGGTYGDWEHDFKLRLQIINQKETYDNLKQLEKDMIDLMDKDDKKALIIAKIQKLQGQQQLS